MSGAGGSERPEQRLEQRPEERPEHRQRVVPPIPALGQGGVLQELMLGVGQPPDPGISEEQRQAREEWEALEEIQSGAAPPPISFSEALQHFQSAELSSSRGKVRAPGRRGILAALLRCLCGPPRLRPQLRGEQELALAMAQCALDDSERVHMRILQTIYRQLTRSRLGCPRYGEHWEELGFQGADPGTDLRGTGMLGLMQILFFVLDSRTLPLAREIFQLSQHETQNFPFCIMSVNITRIVIQALQEERLSRECNRRQQVIAVLNDLYAAAFLRLSRLWEQQHGTVANAAFFLKELELSTKKKPRQLLKSLEAYLSRSLRPPSPPSSSQIQFTSICDPGVELEGDS
ncbi:ELMO domain-containing protein 3 isoform X2 [Onychostruthus taczanowskii]|uniref:ELMO domain-containing protein 3 isoform X2 n=1 Tax=Onychostruthus taczanowskii TaxID=356909 RepID=UPI001B7FFC3D|nr:ELMO domain-containing protein 3 isoform X2 [Onychostruthus taczanowskii]